MQVTVLEVVPGSIEFNFANGSKRTMLISRIPEKDRARVEEAKTLPVHFTFPATLGPETVTVTSKTETSIKCRRASDGQPFTIPTSKLSETDKKWVVSLPMKWPRPSGARGEKKPEGLEMELGRNRKELEALDCVEIQRGIKSNDPKIDAWIASQEWDAKVWHEYHSEYRYQSQIPLILELVPKTEDETVSLRKELEKAGVKSIAQTPNACTFYSGYFLYQYLIREKGLEPIPFETFKATARAYEPKWPAELLAKTPGLGERFAKESVIKAGLKLRGIQPTFTPLYGPNETVRVELIKHFLRKGRPIWGAIRTKKGEPHAVLFTGFQTSNKKTRFEILESQGAGYGDGGYEMIDDTITEAYLLE